MKLIEKNVKANLRTIPFLMVHYRIRINFYLRLNEGSRLMNCGCILTDKYINRCR